MLKSRLSFASSTCIFISNMQTSYEVSNSLKHFMSFSSIIIDFDNLFIVISLILYIIFAGTLENFLKFKTNLLPVDFLNK